MRVIYFLQRSKAVNLKAQHVYSMSIPKIHEELSSRFIALYSTHLTSKFFSVRTMIFSSSSASGLMSVSLLFWGVGSRAISEFTFVLFSLSLSLSLSLPLPLSLYHYSIFHWTKTSLVHRQSATDP